jgi:hypothetical protein
MTSTVLALATVAAWIWFIAVRPAFVRQMIKARQADLLGLLNEIEAHADAGEISRESDFYAFNTTAIRSLAGIAPEAFPGLLPLFLLHRLPTTTRHQYPNLGTEPESKKFGHLSIALLAAIAEIYRYRSVTFWIVFQATAVVFMVVGTGLRVYELAALLLNHLLPILEDQRPRHA